MAEFKDSLQRLADNIIEVVAEGHISDDYRSSVMIVLRTLCNHTRANETTFQGMIIQQAMGIINHAKGLPDVFCVDKMFHCQRLIIDFLSAEKTQRKASLEARKAEIRERVRNMGD